MEPSANYNIYNASAGSGKTFNLVRIYLNKILSSKSPLAFGQALALTFTNKAVGEMKERIIKMLKEFSSSDILRNPTDMFIMIKTDLNIDSEELKARSTSALLNILHNYASFDISTIDKFNHRLIRTFSNDLKLPANFEVELDVGTVLSKAVDKLLDMAGRDKEITDLLIKFALEKVDDDKSWDVSYDLNEIAKILLSDEDRLFVEKLSGKSLRDFSELKKIIKQKISTIEKSLVLEASKLLETFNRNSISEGVLNSTLTNHFKKIRDLEIHSKLYDNQLKQNLENNTKISLSKATVDKAAAVDNLIPEIYKTYIDLKQKVFNLLFLKNALKHITPLSVINELNKCLKDITAEESIVLITDFNKIINKEIKQQPAPYIYERLGERYKDYFIDEFQDTSELQWENLRPLIDNAVSQESLSGKRGSVMLVGDAKQAIYRWRGSKPEQFINLYKKIDSAFEIAPQITNLENNYRSNKTIVEFNNTFFDFVSKTIFGSDVHSELYSKSSQNYKIEGDGYVQIEFLSKEIDDKDLEFAERTLQIIDEAQKDNYKLSDICILTRTRKEGVNIANFLSENQIKIISSETLLLANSPKVGFIISILNALENPENYEAKVSILNYLFHHSKVNDDEHSFYIRNLSKDNSKFFKALSEYGYPFPMEYVGRKPFYELVEQIIRSFKLNEKSDAYVQFLLDEVFQFTQKSNSGQKEFLDLWERKKDKLSIVSPTGTNAVKIMTIHKSKGLEFPIVIFPYASRNIYGDRGSKVWYPVNADDFSDFSHLYIGLNKEIKEYGKIGNDIYDKHQSTQELDSLNLLYVTLTRPMERLYIISENDTSKTNTENFKKFSELYLAYIKNMGLFEEDKLIYEFGRRTKNSDVTENLPIPTTLNLISTSREAINLNILTKQGLLWETDRKEAIEKGNLLHYILSLIDYSDDIEEVFAKLMDRGEINLEQAEILIVNIKQITKHKVLSDFYTQKWGVINEREIVTADGELHRPDRIVINEDIEAVIIDYKTGKFASHHQTQINLYAELLTQMNYRVLSKYLVYIGEEIEIVEI